MTIGTVVDIWVKYLQFGYPDTDKGSVCICLLNGCRPSTCDVHSLDKGHSMVQCLAQLHIDVFRLVYCPITPEANKCERDIYGDQGSPFVSFWSAHPWCSKVIWDTPQPGRCVGSSNGRVYMVNDFSSSNFGRLQTNRPRVSSPLCSCEDTNINRVGTASPIE